VGISHTAQPLGYGWTTEEAWFNSQKDDYGVHPTSCLTGIGSACPGLKRPGHDRDHSLPFSAKVRMSTALPPFPHTPSWLAQRLLCIYLLVRVFVTWKQLAENSLSIFFSIPSYKIF
jgi:hypothetical protein